MRANSRQKNYLALTALVRKHNLALPELLDHCRAGRLDAVQQAGEWFVNESELGRCRQLGRPKDFALKHPYLKTLACLVLSLYLVLFAQLLTANQFGDYLALGGRETVRAAAETIGSLPPLRLGAAPIMTTIETQLSTFWLFWSDLWGATKANLAYFVERITIAWRNFLTPGKAGSDDQVTITLDQDVIARLKAEIKAELENELRLVAPGSAGPETGLVVLPSSGDLLTDQATAEELSRAFSDQVEVRFEENGQTGLITPLFKSGPGRDYLFVITPINQLP